MKDWSVYECLNCEVDHEGSAFLLSYGHWYRVAQDFVTKVNDFVDQVPCFTRPLPIFEDKSEGAYNARVAAMDPQIFALMDRKAGPTSSSSATCLLWSAI